MARSRRTTPQTEQAVGAAQASTAPIATRARSTRSRSHDIPTAATQPAPTRTTRRGARQESVESTASAESRNARVLGRNARAPADGNLTAVVEEESDDEEPENFRELRQSPGGISGTTAISDNEAGELDPESIVLDLPAFYHAAEEILRIAVPPTANSAKLRETIQEIKKPGSIVAKRLNRSETAFLSYKNIFGEASDYINSTPVMKAIFGSLPPRDAEDWRLTEILQTANLAWLAKWIVSAERDSSDSWDKLRDLDLNFPLHFLSSIFQSQSGMSASLMIGSTALLEETFSTALDIRTQMAVLTLTREHNTLDFDSELALRNVFYMVPDPDALDNETLRAWNVNGLGGGDLGLIPEFDQQIQQRISEIRQCFLEDSQLILNGDATDLQKLHTRFPWSNFAGETLKWIRRRNEELSRSIKKQGGVESIGGSLKEILAMENSMISTRIPRAKAPKATAHEDSPVPSGKKKKIKHSRKREYRGLENVLARHSGVAATAIPDDVNLQIDEGGHIEEDTVHQRPDNTPIPPVDMIDDAYLLDNDDVSEPADAVPSSAVPTSAHVQNLLKKKKANKENVPGTHTSSTNHMTRRYIDPQPDARRLEWDEETQGPSQRRPPSTGQPRVPVSKDKRPRADTIEEEAEDEDDMVSQDEGFETDERVLPPSERRKQTAHTSRPSPPKRQRRVIQRERSASADYQPSQERSNRQSGGLSDDIRRTNDNIRSTARATQAAERVVLRGPRQMQQRRPWTRDEEQALINYIEENGTSWSTIKAIDNGNKDLESGEYTGPLLLEGREQVALKDKARNMRFDYHKRGLLLPLHFNQVTISKSQRDTLGALGIDYDE